MARFDPTRPDFAPYGLTCVRWTPSLMRRPDRHNEVELNLLETGSITYLLGGMRARVESGRLAVFWAAIPHQIIDVSGARPYYVATLPLAWFLQCGLPERLVQPILHGRMVCEPGGAGSGATAAEDVARFRQWAKDLAAGKREEAGERAVLLEIEARLLRLSTGLPEGDGRAARPGGRKRGGTVEREGLSKAEQMACFIAQHYLEPLAVEDISHAVGLHPNYAMGLFKTVFATTLSEYLTQHRVSHAQRLLATTDQKVLSVALNSGFGSISRFNEAFRRACGCSPREYRGGHRIR